MKRKAVMTLALDGVDEQILSMLQENARATWAEIGASVGRSAPAVCRRVQLLEESGVILGYTARVDRSAL
jgi:Lrp/AsnC family leucine-responsive transcriptional regulator